MESIIDKVKINNEDKSVQKIENKKRVQYIDIARGIAIILMVIGHTIDQGVKRNIIFSFHMPLFIIISGFFYKDKPFKKTIKDIFLKLILPYIICTLLVNIVKCNDIHYLGNQILEWLKQIVFSYSYIGKLKFTENVSGLGALWFFPLLALVRLIFIAIKKISENDNIKLCAFCMLISYVGYILGINKYFLPFSLDIAMLCLIFYCFGYILSKNDLLEKLLSNNIAILIMLTIWVIGIKFNWIEIAIRRYPNGAYSIMTAICGTMVILKISQLIEKYFKVLGNVLAWYGKNSMYVLLFHHLERSLVKYGDIFKTEGSIFKMQVICMKMVIITVGTKCIEEIKKIKYLKNE